MRESAFPTNRLIRPVSRLWVLSPPCCIGQPRVWKGNRGVGARPKLRGRVAKAVDRAGIRLSVRFSRVGEYVLGGLLSEGQWFQDREAEHSRAKGVYRRVRTYLLERVVEDAARADRPTRSPRIPVPSDSSSTPESCGLTTTKITATLGLVSSFNTSRARSGWINFSVKGPTSLR